MCSSKEARRARHAIPSFSLGLLTSPWAPGHRVGHLENAAPLHRLDCGGQYPAAWSRLRSRTWERRAGRRGPALRPRRGGALRARPREDFPGMPRGLHPRPVRPGRRLRPILAHPGSPATRVWRPVEELRRLARYAAAWADGRAGAPRASMARARGRGLQWGLQRPGADPHRPTQDGVDFLGLGVPEPDPDAQKRSAGLGMSRASLQVR